MGKLVYKYDENIAAQAEGRGIQTGLHTVKVIAAYVKKSKNGNNLMDISIETKDGGTGTIFGMCMDENWESGAKNYDYARFQEFMGINKVKSVTLKKTKREIKNKQEKALEIAELKNKKCIMGLFYEHDINTETNEPTKKLKLQNTLTLKGLNLKGKDKMESLKEKIADYETKAFLAAEGGSSKGKKGKGKKKQEEDEDEDDFDF